MGFCDVRLGLKVLLMVGVVSAASLVAAGVVAQEGAGAEAQEQVEAAPLVGPRVFGEALPGELDPVAACLSSLAAFPFDDEPCQRALGTVQTSDMVRYHQVSAALAAGYARAGDERALDFVDVVRGAVSEDWLVQNNFGVALLYLNRFGEARNAFTLALRDAGAPGYVYMNRALAWRGMGEFAAADQDVARFQAQAFGSRQQRIQVLPPQAPDGIEPG